MALLVTLFLVLTNIFNTITNVSPNVEGMTAIASWMIACMFFVFLALLEYATILYFQLVSRTALNGKKCTSTRISWVLFQIRRKFQLVKKRRNLTVIHNKDCFLYQGSELNKRKDEISGIEQSQRWILRCSLARQIWDRFPLLIYLKMVLTSFSLHQIVLSYRLAKTDTIFMYVFPVTFIVFNVFYWPFWTNYWGPTEKPENRSKITKLAWSVMKWLF